MIQIFVDDSGGKGHGNTIVLAGLLAPAESWLRFSDEWRVFLAADPPISRFKMREAATRRGAFRALSAEERDAKARGLVRLINEHVSRVLYCTIDLPAFVEDVAPYNRKPLNEPYFWACQIVLMAVAIEQAELGHTDRFEIIFDEHVIFQSRVKMWYPVIRHLMTSDEQALFPVDPLFRRDDDFMPLQAADLVAWCIRRDIDGKPHPFGWVVPELRAILSDNSQWMRGWVEESFRIKINPEMVATYGELLAPTCDNERQT